MNGRANVAVIGTGIAGMAAAYFLRDRYEVTLFEKDSRPGGHTHTVMAEEDGNRIPIDTGFMVYNERTYPNLVRFFKELEVPTKPTSMSFSVQHCPSGLEYCGTGISGLFSQKRNWLNPRYLFMLASVHRFNQECGEVLEDPKFEGWTIQKYAAEKKHHPDLLEKYLIPMSSAIWSTPPGQMLDFPALTLVRFFKNHGLLGLSTHFQWRTVDGGSRVYRDKVLSFFPGKLRTDSGVRSVRRTREGVEIRTEKGQMFLFSKAVLACHADEALKMLDPAEPLEKELLEKFRYSSNRAALHTDPSGMPQNKKAWSSWNYRVEPDGQPTTIYWMNSLQRVSKNRDYFVSINDPGSIDPEKVLWDAVYEHPVYDLAAVRAQERLSELNEKGPVYFCGSYFRYGFHEDAFVSGMNAARSLSGMEVW